MSAPPIGRDSTNRSSLAEAASSASPGSRTTAVKRNEAADAPLLGARSRFEWAQALRARGGPGDEGLAEQFTRAAQKVAISLGALQLEEACAVALRAVA